MKYEKICLMIPTYKRPEWLGKIIDSAVETADDVSRLRFSFCVNVKDDVTRKYLSEKAFPAGCEWEIIDESTRQPNLALYFNKMFDETKFNGDDTLATELGDDMVFVTRGWDTIILEEMNKADGLVIVYCDDDYIAHDKCCVNLFVSRKLVALTRKPFMCPYFHADMIDLVWTMVGAISGILRYLPSVVIRHNHSTAEKDESKWDDTFKRLAPVQKSANSKANHKLAFAYSTMVAKNLIDSGVGKWNVLQ